MRIEKTGDYLVLKDNQNEIEYITPCDGIFLQKHSSDDNIILLSERSNRSPKDSINIKVSEVDKVGEQLVYNLSRGVLFIFLSMLLDASKSILDTVSYIDAYRIETNPSVNYFIDTEELFEEKRHFFNAYFDSNATFNLSELPESNVSFRITNASPWNLFLKDSNENSIIALGASTAIQQPIKGGSTVNVSFDKNTGIYTITDL